MIACVVNIINGSTRMDYKMNGFLLL